MATIAGYMMDSGTWVILAHILASGRLNMSSTTLPMYMLAIMPQTRSGLLWKRAGPGVSPCMTKAPKRMATVGEVGMPKVNRGIIAAPEKELLAVSGPATPSMAPLPKREGSFDIFFSNE